MAKGPGAPSTSFHYTLIVEGVDMGQFVDASLTSEVTPVEFLEGGERIPKVLPGRPKPSVAVLTRGHTTNLAMFAWHEQVAVDPTDVRKNCVLLVSDQANRPVARYQLEAAWPAKIVVSDLDAGTNEVLFETITFVCDHISRVAI